MMILKGILYYFLCLMIFGFSFSLAHKFIDNGNTMFLTILFIYLGCGLFLFKKIYKNLVTYNPTYATIDNMAMDKISNIALWFFKFPVLLFKLTLLKVL